MNAKEYLQQLKKLDIKINQKIKELEDLKVTARSIGSIDYSKERVQSSSSKEASFVKTIEKISVLENEINAKIDEFVDEKHKIVDQIQGLENHLYEDILYKHYVEYKDFKVISKEMNYVYGYVKQLHRDAIKDFETSYPNLPYNVL